MLRNSIISSLEESGVASIDVENKILGVYVAIAETLEHLQLSHI